MTIPTPTYGEWLQDQALYVNAEDGVIAAAWGDEAPKGERISPLANRADAVLEAARQLTFMGQAFAKERHVIPGRFQPYIGQVINITCDMLGYQGGLDVLVLGAADNLATGMSSVTVLRRL